MAHHAEPMEVDCIDNEFDNKENTFHHSNVLPCTEKGYEELDVSELNMKLRYSMTPASSPMSKSYTASLDNRQVDTDNLLNYASANSSLTRSLNSTVTKNDSVMKSLKSLPLQSLPTEQFIDGNGNASLLRQSDLTITNDANVTVTVSEINDINENLSLPSSSSSALQTPEATTPTKEIVKDGGSPIIRGLKSVLNMFRPSQSPILPPEDIVKQETSPADVSIIDNTQSNAVASTPIAAHRNKDGNTSKRSSPLKDSIVFKDDLEKELNWKDETTILFSEEKIPIHKLFFQNSKPGLETKPAEIECDKQNATINESFNLTVEYMDVSNHESLMLEKTMTELQPENNLREVSVAVESDSEFVDCETYSKNESQIQGLKKAESSEVSPAVNIQNVNATQDLSLTADNKLEVNPLSDITGIWFAEGENKDDVTPSDYSDYSKETTELLSELEKFEKCDTAKKIPHKIENSVDVSKCEAIVMPLNSTATPEKDQPTIIPVEIIGENKEISDMPLKTMESQESILGNKDIFKETSYNHVNEFSLKELHHNLLVNRESLPTQSMTLENNLLTIDTHGHISENVDVNIQPKAEVIMTSILQKEDKNEETETEFPEPLNPIMSESYIESQTTKSLEVTKYQDTINVPEIVCDVSPDDSNQIIEQNFNKQDLSNLGTQSNDAQMPQLLASDNSDTTMASDPFIDTQNKVIPQISTQKVKNYMDLPVHDVVCFEENVEILHATSNMKETVITPDTILKMQNPFDVPLPDEDEIDIDFLPDKGTLHEETTAVRIPCEIKDMTDNNSNGTNIPENKREINTSLHVASTSLETGLPQQAEVLEFLVPELNATVTFIENPLETVTDEYKTIQETTSYDLNVNKTFDENPQPAVNVHEIAQTSSVKLNITELLNEKLLGNSSGCKMKQEFTTSDLNVNKTFDDKPLETSNGYEDIQGTTSVELKVTETLIEKPLENSPENSMSTNINVTKIFDEKPLETSNGPEIAQETTSAESVMTDIFNELPSEIAGCEIKQDNMSTEVIVTETLNEKISPDCKINQDIASTDLNVTISLGDNPLEGLPQNISQPPLPDASITTHLETECITTLVLTTTTDSNLGALPIVDKSCPESLPINMSVDEAYNDIAIQTVTIDEFIDPSKLQNTTDTKEVNKAENVESMDITMNETFNQRQELPDVVKQTADVIEQHLTKATDVVIAAETKDLDFEKSEIVTHLDTASKIKENTIEIATDETVDADVLPSRNQDNISSTVVAKDNSDVPDMTITNQPTETLCANVRTAHNIENKEIEATPLDEEIMVSGNNSPYVSVMADGEAVTEKEETFEQIENTFVTNSNISSSPPIVSKGYSFNFDEIEDPLATKTKIRVSPLHDTPIKAVEPNNDKSQFEVPKKELANRRKSQPSERKRPAALKKKFNTTFDSCSSSKSSAKKEEAAFKNNILTEINLDRNTEQDQNKEKAVSKISCDETKLSENNVSSTENCEKLNETSDNNKTSIDSIDALSNDIKTISSSEQSTYYSAAGSSTESVKAKNVFNLPEIDDMNFNPFATKSKMCQSPPPDMENPFATKTKIQSSPDSSMIVTAKLNRETCPKQLDHKKAGADDKTETELMEKETCNISNETFSSKGTDNQNLTTREVNTEDEDTIEGPFLEADDVNKMLDFGAENIDMMQFDDSRDHGNDNNMDGEFFIDADAYEFLLNQNKSNIVADSGKESLFLKFDPLFAKRVSSDGVLAALSNVQKRQSTPTKAPRPSLRNEVSPIPGPSTLNVTFAGDNNISQETNEDPNITVSKPMMVVTPAVNPVVTPRNKSITPTRSNRRSITFTSPAIAVIDRLLSMSGNNSFIGQDTTITQANREQHEADIVLTQLRELLAEKEISVCNLRSESKELKDKLGTMLSQVKVLETEGQERLKKINELNDLVTEKTKINRSMAAVVEEYERTIASLIAEIEQDKKRNAEERSRLINERDEQIAHLSSMEVSFSDLHSKYEKSKQIILECKANEETYKKSLRDFEESLTKMQTNYEMLKQHATSKLNNANQELEKINRAHEAEVVKLNAMIKRKDIHITSLEETLAQKTKANEELTAICDELINKVG